MTPDTVIAIAEQIKKQRELVVKLEQALSTMQLSGHQTPITLKIGDLAFPLTELSRETGYAATLIRGREMMMLGAKKAMRATADEAFAVLARLERQLTESVK